LKPRHQTLAKRDLQPTEAGDHVASATRTLSAEIEGLRALQAALNDGLGSAFGESVTIIARSPGRVAVTGIGKSGLVARKIAATLSSTGRPAFFLHPAEASHGDLGMIQAGDVVIALSWSGETAELAAIITFSRRFRIGLIAMTASADSALGREADVALVLPKAEEACPNGLAPTTSTTMQLALGDALAVALLEARGFTARDFSVFHPGGKLGARLTYVRDVMHAGSRLPLARADASLAEVVLEITSKGFGCVGIVDAAGRLAGIFTDGDLRRHIRADLAAVAVASVMTRRPRTIEGDALAVEALDILNAAKITALFVLDAERRPAGIVHIHDLLRLGVA